MEPVKGRKPVPVRLPVLTACLSEGLNHSVKPLTALCFWPLLSGPCPHLSVPVEMDESMTPSSLDLALSSICKHCSGRPESSTQWQGYEEVEPDRPTAAPHPRLMPTTHPGQMSRELPYKQGTMYPCSSDYHFRQVRSVEQGPSLEAPLPLMSDLEGSRYAPPFYHAAHAPGQCPPCVIIR